MICLLVAIYPFMFLVAFVPFYIFELSNPISRNDALEIISTERVKLNIDSGVQINLVLSDEPACYTEWVEPGGPFTITVYKNNIPKNGIEHEMFHIKRILKTKASPPIGFISYFYLEEPLAMVYDRLNIKLLVN